MGGAQTHAAVLTEWLSRRHDVDLIVRMPPFELADLGNMSQTDLRAVRLRVLNWRRQDAAPAIPWDYDVFIPFVHTVPPVCPAPRGVLMVLFPFVHKQDLWPWSAAASAGRSLRQCVREIHHERRWRRTFGGYQACTANSKYTQTWIRHRWNIDSTVVYPPVLLPDREPDPVPQPAVMSVGRFTRSKRQIDLVQAFRSMEQSEPDLAGWRFWCVGGVSQHPDEQRNYEACTAAAAGGAVELLANLSAADLERRFSQAALFWHAAGHGIDETRYPERLEHFGMVTVEAMARGCVPIVVRRGGQPEIVEHGRNGFLWDTIDELHDATMRCVREPELRERLARQATRDAKRYSRDAFIAAMSALLPAGVGDR